MSYAEAIEVIKSMATDLGISMNSTQGQALLTAIEALQIMHISTVEFKENKWNTIKQLLAKKCRYAIWDSIYAGYGEDIDYIDGCEKGNKIFDILNNNNYCKGYRSINEISKLRID